MRLVATAGMLGALTAVATAQDLAGCAGIKIPAMRLLCFDGLAKKVGAPANRSPPSRPSLPLPRQRRSTAVASGRS
ncbi:MAG: hypothetical protein J2P50_14095, partial [Hyphomicrobiaceae bacterium]|nr:hypothetical protein [Hyphomicrobiaceae bacterium]